MAKQQTDNLWGDWAQFKNAIEDVSLAIGDKLNPNLRLLTQELTKVITRTGQLIELASDTALWKFLNWNIDNAVAWWSFLAKGLVDATEAVLRFMLLVENGLSIGAWIEDAEKMQQAVDKHMRALERAVFDRQKRIGHLLGIRG